MGIPYCLRDYLLGQKRVAIRKSAVNVDKVASLAASRRAAWEQGAFSLGRTLELQHFADHGEIAKNTETDLGT